MALRLGIFGGTFDPVHIGHLVAASGARHQLGLDRVVLMVANIPWQKEGSRALSPVEDRFEMVRAAIGGVQWLEAGRAEIDRGGPSYTADTLEELARLVPGAELFVIVGADVSAQLASWERPEVVRARSTLVVVNRPGTPVPLGLEDQGWRVEHVQVPSLCISSTDLRRRVSVGEPVDFLVPPGAVDVIRERGLYSGEG